MATSNATSAKDIVRKIMRDLNPADGNWIYDAVEWIGEALEHIGAGAHVETKGCILDVKDFKGMLPPDLYYVNQVSINQTEQSVSLRGKIDELQEEIKSLRDEYTVQTGLFASTVTQLADGTISSGVNQIYLESLDKLRKNSDQTLNKLYADAHVIYNSYMQPSTGRLTPLQYCTTNFPRGIHCDECINETVQSTECYLLENNMIKTSFKEGKVCLSYTGFATDTDCYPLLPDDISFKEATFWYVYKKLLLSGMFDPSKNGVDYNFADQKWKYYCTQARNSAKFPDITKYESFMNQWVRLVPRISQFDDSFEDLGVRENLYRGNYSTDS